jgi:hypothetical protein
MKCVSHSSNNMLLGAPKDMPNCETVPATMMTDAPEGQVIITTFWQPTPEELELINEGKKITLYVWGISHPPVAIGVEP